MGKYTWKIIGTFLVIIIDFLLLWQMSIELKTFPFLQTILPLGIAIPTWITMNRIWNPKPK